MACPCTQHPDYSLAIWALHLMARAHHRPRLRIRVLHHTACAHHRPSLCAWAPHLTAGANCPAANAAATKGTATTTAIPAPGAAAAARPGVAGLRRRRRLCHAAAQLVAGAALCARPRDGPPVRRHAPGLPPILRLAAAHAVGAARNRVRPLGGGRARMRVQRTPPCRARHADAHHGRGDLGVRLLHGAAQCN